MIMICISHSVIMQRLSLFYFSFVGALPTSNIDSKNLDHVCNLCVCL